MLQRTLIALTAALVLAAAPAVPRAQETDDALAKKYYQLGKELYNRSDYEGALSQFKQSYKYSKKSGLLFNIARCHEGLAQLTEAITSYEEFLKTNPQNAGEVRGRITNLKKRLERQKPPDTPAKPDKPVTPDKPDKPAPAIQADKPDKPDKPVTPPITEPAPSQRSGALGTAGWVTLGAGAAALITGVVLGAAAAGMASSVEDGAASGDEWSNHKDDWESGEAMQLGQIVGLAAGGALVATGAVLLFLHYRSSSSGSDSGERQAIIAPGALPGGACLTGTWHF